MTTNAQTTRQLPAGDVNNDGFCRCRNGRSQMRRLKRSSRLSPIYRSRSLRAHDITADSSTFDGNDAANVSTRVAWRSRQPALIRFHLWN